MNDKICLSYIEQVHVIFYSKSEAQSGDFEIFNNFLKKKIVIHTKLATSSCKKKQYEYLALTNDFYYIKKMRIGCMLYVLVMVCFSGVKYKCD